jgi:hypothetical protein
VRRALNFVAIDGQGQIKVVADHSLMEMASGSPGCSAHAVPATITVLQSMMVRPSAADLQNSFVSSDPSRFGRCSEEVAVGLEDGVCHSTHQTACIDGRRNGTTKGRPADSLSALAIRTYRASARAWPVWVAWGSEPASRSSSTPHDTPSVKGAFAACRTSSPP